MNMIKKITSATNNQIKEVCDLHHAKHRKECQQFIAEGLRIISTFIDSGWSPAILFATPEQLDTAQRLSPTSQLIEVPMSVMQKMSAAHSPSGLLGVFSIRKPKSVIGAGIALAQIADPGNMGTLLRSAAAFGAQSAVIIEGCDPWSPKVIQASAGTIAQLDLYELTWQELLDNKGKIQLCALVVEGGKQPQEASLKNSLIVIGNEANGIPREWIEQCDLKVTLPMSGNTESLNAAIAGSIALYLAQSGA